MFALVDCNNFYASCERVFRPDLNGKPIVILSNNDGCVIARSNEAKALGIPMGAPAFKFKNEFIKHGISVFSSNYPLYGDMSARVMTILGEMAPEIEIYSIDEAFLRFENCDYVDLETLGLEMRRKVLRSTGIPVSVGFAPTKSLAKVANRIAKKYTERTQGVYLIDSEEKRLKALKWLDVGDVWGIGRRHAKRLNAGGIKTAYDFVNLPDAWVRKNMSVVGLRLKKELEGEPMTGVEETAKAKKNIATTRSFEKGYTKYDELAERIVTFASSCSEKLRAQKSQCNSIMVFIHTNGFRKDLPQYSRNIVVDLPFPSSSSIELAKFAQFGLRQIFRDGYTYKKAGVIVLNITPESEQQLSLFENSDPRHKKLMQTVDVINRSIGNHTIKLGSQDLNRVWKMKQEHLSPRYTTKIDEVIKVK